jgi:hypothetical protein
VTGTYLSPPLRFAVTAAAALAAAAHTEHEDLYDRLGERHKANGEANGDRYVPVTAASMRSLKEDARRLSA